MADITTAIPPIFTLPDELLEAIVLYLPPIATVAFGSTCRRNKQITFEPLVWRRHCIQKWKYWHPRHALLEKLDAPPVQTKWLLLYNERTAIDNEAKALFDKMLLTQQHRLDRMGKIAENGYNVKDLLLELRDSTRDDAEDVLARRYHANAILGQIHRAAAIEKWTRLNSMQMIKLEEVLGAFDLFVLGGAKGDLKDLHRKLDEIANAIRDRDAEWDQLSTRTKAIRIVKYLRSEELVGNPHPENYHDLRNNFITMALFSEQHTSLPLQSVAIYCAVCRRLGIDAKPANYPSHVHAVITGPRDQTLDGKVKAPSSDPEQMHMDPWRNTEELSIDDLRLRLLQMGAAPHQHAHHLGPATTLEIALRAAKNIMHSVQEARHSQQTPINSEPDLEASWYSMVWAMVVLGSNDSTNFHSLHRRKQCLPYLIDHMNSHFPEDLTLVEKHIPSLFPAGSREHQLLLEKIEEGHALDRTRKAPQPRNTLTTHVRYKIGQYFAHRRYGYEGFIIGWDTRCSADTRWMQQMRVDELPRGREQPFYNVVYDRPPERVFYQCVCLAADDERRADDKSVRYVAEENIGVRNERPGEVLMGMAGRWFKRWDEEEGRFVSNLVDEYPED